MGKNLKAGIIGTLAAAQAMAASDVDQAQTAFPNAIKALDDQGILPTQELINAYLKANGYNGLARTGVSALIGVSSWFGNPVHDAIDKGVKNGGFIIFTQKFAKNGQQMIEQEQEQQQKADARAKINQKNGAYQLGQPQKEANNTTKLADASEPMPAHLLGKINDGR